MMALAARRELGAALTLIVGIHARKERVDIELRSSGRSSRKRLHADAIRSWIASLRSQ